MADPMALTIATSALVAYEHLGMPEGKIPLYNAIIYVCEASKSNSVIEALGRAEQLVKEHKDDEVPSYLRDRNYKVGELEEYLYPHNYGGWVDQQYMPDTLKDEVLYSPSNNGYEKNLVRAKVIRKNKG